MARLTARAKRWFVRFRSNRRLQLFRNVVGTGLRPGQEAKLVRLRDGVGFQGKRVLEIGGDLQGKVARACLALGADHVTSINHDSSFAGREEERLRFLHMDATRLELPAEHFDLVLGIAVLEHVREPDRMLAAIHRVVRPGAHVYLHGSPLWHSKKGHHVVVVGASGQSWRFDGKPGSRNPLKDWEHLLRDPPELQDCLAERGCPRSDVADIVAFVFGSELLNRYSAAHIKGHFSSSRFSTLECVETKEVKAPAETLRLLARRHALPESEFATNSIEFLLRR